jgi:hypothetical protein
MWIPSEIKDPIVQHASTRRSVAFFGAVSLSKGQFVRMMCEVFNAETFLSLLKRMLRHHRCRAHRMVLVLDDARYHHAILLSLSTSALETVAAPVSAALQPATRPIERVWKLTRRFATHNRYFATLPEVLMAVDACFDH